MADITVQLRFPQERVLMMQRTHRAAGYSSRLWLAQLLRNLSMELLGYTPWELFIQVCSQ